MSLYADYLTERTTDSIIETAEGFATYRYLSENQVYLIDLYVKPAYRKLGFAAKLADRVIAEAISRGCTEFIGTVVPTAKKASDSLKVLLAYGMELKSATDNLIVFRKGI